MNHILFYCVPDKSLELLRRQPLSIMQQCESSAFYTVVRWHKQGEVDIECSLHISIVLAICMSKNYQIWWRFNEVLTKTSWVIFLAHPVYMVWRVEAANDRCQHELQQLRRQSIALPCRPGAEWSASRSTQRDACLLLLASSLIAQHI